MEEGWKMETIGNIVAAGGAVLAAMAAVFGIVWFLGWALLGLLS